MVATIVDEHGTPIKKLSYEGKCWGNFMPNSDSMSLNVYGTVPEGNFTLLVDHLTDICKQDKVSVDNSIDYEVLRVLTRYDKVGLPTYKEVYLK